MSYISHNHGTCVRHDLFIPKSAKKGTSAELLPNKSSKDKISYGAVALEDPEAGAHSGHSHSHGHSSDHSHSEHSHAPISTSSFDSGKTELKPSESAHDHEHNDKKGNNEKRDLNIEAAYLHVVTDLIQSVGVALAGLLIWVFPQWQIIDPICTFIFTLLVMWYVYMLE